MSTKQIRNIAIIAHVDHGKTTRVDQLLRQSGTFAEHEKVVDTVMDNNAIEKERDQWVACMVLAMEDVGLSEDVRKVLLNNFFNTADFMRNKEG